MYILFLFITVILKNYYVNLRAYIYTIIYVFPLAYRSITSFNSMIHQIPIIPCHIAITPCPSYTFIKMNQKPVETRTDVSKPRPACLHADVGHGSMWHGLLPIIYVCMYYPFPPLLLSLHATLPSSCTTLKHLCDVLPLQKIKTKMLACRDKQVLAQ